MLYTKRMAGYLFALLAAIQMAAFFLYWQVTANLNIKWIVYLVYWIRNLAQASVPLVTAVGTLLLSTMGHRRLWLFPILPVLSRALYFLPDHYLYYLAGGMNSIEAIGMGALVTLLECAVIYGFVLLLCLLARRIYSHTKNDRNEEEAPKIFSLDNPFVKSVFSISFVYFCLQIVFETVRTVAYLISNAGTYSFEEILTMILSFVMHLGMLFATHTLCMLYVRYARKHYRIPEAEEAI